MNSPIIGARIKALREKRGLSQLQLAELLGFRNRQTLSSIEAGDRKVTVDELLLAAEHLDEGIDYFTDPYRLVAEGSFCWRKAAPDIAAARLDRYEDRVGRWLAAFRHLAPQVGRPLPLLAYRKLGLGPRSTFEAAIAAGEQFAGEFKLGERPAERLTETMEKRLGILVLMVDAEISRGISGAACRLPELDAVLIARGEVVGRRHFDLAHELFHILTWETMPPKRLEPGRDSGGNRVEQLANKFASAVLMPARSLRRCRDWSELPEATLIERLNALADELLVTSSALRWRLTDLEMLRRSTARALPESALRNNGGKASPVAPPPFSRPFADVLAAAIAQGRISVRLAADLINTTIDDLIDLFHAHGVENPVHL